MGTLEAVLHAFEFNSASNRYATIETRTAGVEAFAEIVGASKANQVENEFHALLISLYPTTGEDEYRPFLRKILQIPGAAGTLAAAAGAEQLPRRASTPRIVPREAALDDIEEEDASETSAAFSASRAEATVALDAPAPAPEPNAKNQFPGKLRDMLADADATGVIAWRPATRTFLILDAAAFKSAVLPRYFRASAARATAALDEQTAYESFARQMNYYGFIKPFRNEGRFDLLEGELLDITLPAHFDRLVRNVGPRPRGGARADKRKRVRERLTPAKSAQGGCVAGGASAAAVLNFDDGPDAGSHSGVAPEPVLKKSRAGARKPAKKKSRSGARKPKTTAPL
jgi:hypothetical protein